MSPKKYLQHLLAESSTYDVTDLDKRTISERGIEGFIFDKLMSKKFRKTKADPLCIERVKKAISIQVNAKLPIEVVFFQGGYKLWRLPSAPQADWAEFFNISYLIQYIAPIAATYAHGVNLTYYFHTLLMEKHDNLPTSDIEEYMSSFTTLVDSFQEKLPNNINIKMLRDSDIYSREDYFVALESGKDQAKIDMQSWPASKIEDYRRMARLNIKWDGIKDWTKLTEEQREQKIDLAGQYEHAATTSLPKVMNTVKAENLVLVFTKANPMMIGIGSTYSSIAKYWVGYGILEARADSYLPRILSPSQLDMIKKIDHQICKVDLFPQLSNFESISVYPDKKASEILK